jgi:cyclopropane fatty-acyl-phospholipid synthase-like methyltransferase
MLETRRVSRYVGIDLSYNQVRLAKWLLNHITDAFTLVADVNSLPIAANSFDSAVSVEVVHHLAHRGGFYKEVARALRPGGNFYLAGMWDRRDGDEAEMWRSCGFNLIKCDDITASVLDALEATSENRKELVQSASVSSKHLLALMNWAGVMGHAAFAALQSRDLVYLVCQCTRMF